MIQDLNEYDYWALLREFLFCIFTSFVFIFLLLKILSPKIKISPHISERNINGQKTFVFKVVNRSLYNAYNVKFHLARRDPYIVGGNNINHKMNSIPLLKDELPCIPAWKFKKNQGDYAVLIRTNEDISVDIGTTNLDFQLSVSVCHGLSNITKVQTMYFNKAGNITTENFKFGTSLETE